LSQQKRHPNFSVVHMSEESLQERMWQRSMSAEEVAEASKTQHIKRDSVVVHADGDDDHVDDGRFRFSARTLWSFTGPGFLMSIAYLDPGNIESDLQAGAVAGYSLMWVLWWSTIIGLFLQLLSARLGCVTGLDLGQTCREQYPSPVRYTLWIMMEIAIISSDIQEVIGSAMAINILSGNTIQLWQGALITGVDTFTFLLLEAYGLRKLEALFAVLIATLSFSFGYMFYAHQTDTLEIVRDTVIPGIEGGNAAVEQAVGVLGAVIMPHNLYLHSSLVLSRKIRPTFTAKKEANIYNAIESSIALFISFLVNLFVISVFASAFSNKVNHGDNNNTGLDPIFHQCNAERYPSLVENSSAGLYHPCSGEECVCDGGNIDLLNAGCCLGAKFGQQNEDSSIKYIWAVGLLAAGQSSTMTGTYAGQFVMEGFLQIKIAPWKRVLLTRSFAMIPTVLVAAFASPHILGTLNEWMNILQSVQLPFAMLPLLHFTGMQKIMGPFANGKVASTLGWALAIVVIFINFYQIYTTPMQKCLNSSGVDGMLFDAEGGGGGGGGYDFATSSKRQYLVGADGDDLFGPLSMDGAAPPSFFDYGNGSNATGVKCNVADNSGHCSVGQTCHSELIVIPVALVSVVYLGFVGWLMIGPLLKFSWNPLKDWYEPMDPHRLKMLGPGMEAGLESTEQEKANLIQNAY